MRKPFALALISTITLAVAACGGDDLGSDAPSTDAPSTEAPTTDAPSTEAPTSEAPTPQELAQAFVDPGPYPVGVTTLALEAGNQVEVWYPAVDGTTGTESYDVRDFVPEAIRTLLTADVPAVYEYAAGRDAAAADGSFPVVLFSHGYSGIRLQSTFLTSHLASWGMIVVSPDHWSRDLYHVLSAPVGDRASSITELLASLDLVVGLNTTTGSILEGRVDDSRVVAVGHSAGGGTVLSAALDDRVDGYISLASGILMTTEDTSSDVQVQIPVKPSFFIAGALDGVISAQERTKPSYEGVPEPSRLWIIDGVGHNGFDDFCTFGNGAGIIGVAMASGLGPLLEAQPQLKTLGEDGCLPPSVPVDETFPIIRHAVTAQLRYWFGDDVAPVGLGPDVANAYSVAVEIAEKG